MAVVAIVGIPNTVCVDPDFGASQQRPVEFGLGLELVRIGSATGYDLFNVGNVLEDPAGRLMVVQHNNPRIPVFNKDGELITILGGAGHGPGMFSDPGAIGLIGDSIWITDARLRKAVVFAPDLGHARDAVVAAGAANLAALGSGDRMVAYTSTEDQTQWFAVDGADQRILYTNGSGQPVARFNLDGRSGALFDPFRNTNRVLPVPGKLDLLVLESSGPLLRILHTGWNGDTLRDVVLPVEAQPVTEAWYDYEIDRYEESMSRSVASPGLRAAIQAAIPRPVMTHALGRAILGPDMIFWFGQRRPDGSRWHGVDVKTDEYLGFVDLPGRSEVKSGTRAYVWTLEFDANDVESLVKHPLIPAGQGSMPDK